MKQVLKLARRAGAGGDVPIGAAIVRDGKIIARGENLVQRKKNPTLHAEIVAINRACKKTGQKFLDNCDIYVSLEPCAMCATAISFARIRNIYFAAIDEKGGGITSNARIFDTDKHLWHPNIIQCQEYADESAELLREFFKQQRKTKTTLS
jgi:tRNA(adenine34) deaminase